jgi:hypothetical protein
MPAARASTKPLAFVLQLDPADIPALAARFGDTGDGVETAVGSSARSRGYYTRKEFLTVCRWKSARTQQKAASNSAAAIRAATASAFAIADLTAQVSHLTALSGVGMPTASVLLHVTFPESFPILDVRALGSLGVTGRSSYTPAFWASYVEACRGLAAEHSVSLRTLDKALWQYSKERSAAAGQ